MTDRKTRVMTRWEALRIALFILTHLHRSEFVITITEPKP